QPQVGVDLQYEASAAALPFEPPDLDDAAHRRVARVVQVREPDLMGASVQALHARVAAAAKCVVEPSVATPTHHRGIAPVEHEARRVALEAALVQGAVQAGDDVLALAKRPQRGLGFRSDAPLAGTHLVGEAEAPKLTQACQPRPLQVAGAAR